MQALEKYIRYNFKSKTEFAKHNNIHKAQVSLWIKKGYMVDNNILYSGIRELNPSLEGSDNE